MGIRKEQLISGLLKAGSIFLISQLLLFEFSIATRKKIINRDVNCVRCGALHKDCSLECSHINHNQRLREYDSPENGELLCRICHYLWHFDHQDDARTIGLSRKDNQTSIKSIYGRMNDNELDKLEYILSQT